MMASRQFGQFTHSAFNLRRQVRKAFAPPIAQIVSHYRILDKLVGAGGMGVVGKACDTRLDRFVALRFLPAAKMSDPERKRRLVQEAWAASATEIILDFPHEPRRLTRSLQKDPNRRYQHAGDLKIDLEQLKIPG